MRHYRYPRLSPWVDAIKEMFGKEWFRFSQLQTIYMTDQTSSNPKKQDYWNAARAILEKETIEGCGGSNEKNRPNKI